MNQTLTYRSAAACHCLAGAQSNTFYLLARTVLLIVGYLLELFSFIFVSMNSALSCKTVANEGHGLRYKFSDAFFTSGKIG